MSILSVSDGPPPWALALFSVGQSLVKNAGDEPEVSYSLSGTLQLSSTGWLLLSVPNAIVRGVFASMKEPGIELPPSKDGTLNAHISVMKPAELEMIGGADRVTERGKQFSYTFGRFYSVEPEGWPEVERVWYVRVHSPELQLLRRGYGLSGLPNEGKHDFHVTVAIRRRGVLGRNNTSKAGDRVPRDD